MIIVNVSEDGSLTLPQSSSRFLKLGRKFLFFQSDDEIVLKRINASDIKGRALSPSKRSPMAMDEICELVRDVRRSARKRK